MHELSMAMSLIDMASEYIHSIDGGRVEAVHVRIGPLAGVVTEALAFSFEIAVQDSPIAGARLVVEEAPIIARCDRCAADRTIPSAQHLRCPMCGAATPNLISGRELELVALEIEEPEPNDYVAAAHR
jgi:hydrogenase nickel incorporation protein HypA/HybF